MSTKAEIIEAGARAIHEDQCSSPDEVCNPDCFRVKELAEAALSAMLLLIKRAMIDEIRSKLNQRALYQGEVATARNRGLHDAAQLIERFEL